MPLTKTLITDTALEVSNLECVRGRRVLFRDVHFKLEAGAMLHIRGQNGVGKTSLLRILCGLSLPEVGDVRWNGTPILQHRATYHRALAYLGHQAALNDALTPQQNLIAAHALCGRAATRSVEDALQYFAVADCRAPCGELSAGQQRRVALASVWLRGGAIWILDEPAAALDAAAVALVEQMLGAHLAGGGMAVVTSHRKLAPVGMTVREMELVGDDGARYET